MAGADVGTDEECETDEWRTDAWDEGGSCE